MSEKNKISRREFLSYSAMAGAIGALGVTPLLSPVPVIRAVKMPR